MPIPINDNINIKATSIIVDRFWIFDLCADIFISYGFNILVSPKFSYGMTLEILIHLS